MSEQSNITDGGTAGTGQTEVLPERNSEAPEQGQGEDQANALGGGDGETGAGLTGAGASTGDASDMRSEGGGGASIAPDAGSPGGLGGVGASGGTGTGRPPGGVSPLGSSDNED